MLLRVKFLPSEPWIRLWVKLWSCGMASSGSGTHLAGGSEVAKYCHSHLPEELALTDSYQQGQMGEALIQVMQHQHQPQHRQCPHGMTRSITNSHPINQEVLLVTLRVLDVRGPHTGDATSTSTSAVSRHASH